MGKEKKLPPSFTGCRQDGQNPSRTRPEIFPMSSLLPTQSPYGSQIGLAEI